MSFGSPIWLISLLAVPAALAVYLARRRRAKRYAVRFSAVSTLLAAAGSTGPSWRRWVPAALVLAAIATLGVALARPRVSYRTPIDEASIVLVTDHSGSMAASDVQPTRLQAAVNAANTFISQLPAKARVGAIGFSSAPDAVQAPATDHSAARSLIDSEQASGATDTGDALQLGLQLLHGTNAKHPPSAIVLLSDGAANTGIDAATVARQAGKQRIPIYTVALGTTNATVPNPDPFGPPLTAAPDPQLMAQIAKLSGGRTFDAQSADELSSIYKKLGTQLGSVTRKREVTATFAVAGLVLLALAALGSSRWAGRIP